MATTTKSQKVSSDASNPVNNNSLLVERESVLEDIRNELEKRFNQLRDQAMNTTNVWERYEIDIMLKELKFVYENLLK